MDILHVVQLIFAVLTSAMHDDPANRSYFEINVILCNNALHLGRNVSIIKIDMPGTIL